MQKKKEDLRDMGVPNTGTEPATTPFTSDDNLPPKPPMQRRKGRFPKGKPKGKK